ncbi:tripartite motif-containing protein 16-like, partial [Pholidichthys leucotaenia]
CSICLELLKDPVTIPCGHSYCMACVTNYWDKNIYICPQCRKAFQSKPDLVKNSVLAQLVEDLEEAERPGPSAAYAEPGDVVCDFCIRRKRKASMSCLSCTASYCDEHLLPHYSVTPLKKHKLIEATSDLQENICPRHEIMMEIFCRTDQQCICHLCLMDEHKDHDMVPAAAERAEKQAELKQNQPRIQQRIKDREKDAQELETSALNINASADKALKDCDKIIKDSIVLIQKKTSELMQKIQTIQKYEGSRVKVLQEEIQQEITELKKKNTELERLLSTENHVHFLKNYSPLLNVSKSSNLPSTPKLASRYCKTITGALSTLKDKLEDFLNKWPKALFIVTNVGPPVPQDEPKTREGFLKYACQLTLDPNTMNSHLLMTHGNRKARVTGKIQNYPSHPDRFIKNCQVLCRECLSGCHYWEVKLSGVVAVAAAYKEIRRAGTPEECGFGLNDRSWVFTYSLNSSMPGNSSAPVCDAVKLGVYLDHRAGRLSFYDVSETMTLLHRIQTRFTQPLYPGFWLLKDPGSIELCDLNLTRTAMKKWGV